MIIVQIPDDDDDGGDAGDIKLLYIFLRSPGISKKTIEYFGINSNTSWTWPNEKLITDSGDWYSCMVFNEII